ncbi:MAG TPA: cytochrome c oxidase subunit II [Candidatus Dormibacteraeota bacterium]|nr:cytochrome c oxidase subunit II [Candidatus Dormibacteraeota bacterium]
MSLLGVDTSPLHSAGPVNDHINFVYTFIFWTSVVIFFGVASAIVYFALRFRRKSDDEEPVQTHGNNRLEVIWTAIPFAILATLFGITASNMSFITSAPANSMKVCVEGVQFSWTFYYEDSCGTPHATSGGRVSYRPADPAVVSSGGGKLYIPVGKPVALEVVSDDVNHSFYVPRLAGQVNAIPGQPNHMWLQADRAGEFKGQCTELCGSGHAGMLLDVIAIPTDNFDTCLNQLRNKQPPSACTGGNA